MCKKWALFSVVWSVSFVENKFWIAPWGDGFVSENTGKIAWVAPWGDGFISENTGEKFWVAPRGDEFIWFTPGDFCTLKSRCVVLDLWPRRIGVVLSMVLVPLARQTIWRPPRDFGRHKKSQSPGPPPRAEARGRRKCTEAAS